MDSSLSKALLQSTVYTAGNRRVRGAEAVNRALIKREKGVRLSRSSLMAKRRSSGDVMEVEGKVMVQTYGRAPVVVVRGEGCMVYDCEGREYLDMTAGIGVNVLGHGDPEWSAAVSDQAMVLTHVSNNFYSLPQVELAERLVESSFADRVFFANSGTEANEAAVKFSRKFQRISHPNENNPAGEFIAFTNSFHGRTMGALALTSKEQYRAPFEPLMAGVTFLEYGNGEAVKKVMQSGNVAAVFVEPVQGEGGIHAATKEFLQSLRDACNTSGSLLVFDEVQCGLGRTGFLWAHEEYGIFPDMMTIAKPLAGGLPIGVVLVSERVAVAISHGDHGSTFAGGPLVCRAALSVLDKVWDDAFLRDVARKGRYLKDALEEKMIGNRHVREVRGKGLLLGVQLDVPASPLVDSCRDSGMLVLTAGRGDVIRLIPPLVISDPELERAVGIIQRCLPALDTHHK